MDKASATLVLIFSFTAGIAFRSFFDLGFQFTIFLFLITGTFFLLWLFKKEKIFIGVCLVVLCFAGGILRFDISNLKQGNEILNGLVEKQVTAVVVVTDEPDIRDGHVNLMIDFEKLITGDITTNLDSRARITVESYPEWEYGDRVLISGELLKPKTFSNDETGKEFNYPAFLAKDGIYYQMFYPDISIVDKGNGNFVKDILFSFKKRFLNNISKVIPEPQASLLGGLVVGAKQSLGNDLLDDFRTTGIIHIVVLSGYNVTIIAESIMNALSFAPRLWASGVGALSIIFFAIMTGAGATIVRASIMALLVIVARSTGRRYEITIGLFIAGFVMLLVNPKILIFDPSFQLSFLATLGLIYAPTLFDKYTKWIPQTFNVRDFTVATIATQLFVLPLLLFQMGQLSLVALPVNVLVLGIIPVTMLFGFLTGLVGFASIALSFPLAFITYVFLQYVLSVVDLFSSLPFASANIQNFPIWLMLLVYCVYGIWIKRSKN